MQTETNALTERLDRAALALLGEDGHFHTYRTSPTVTGGTERETSHASAYECAACQLRYEIQVRLGEAE